jgi:hypothetical protein
MIYGDSLRSCVVAIVVPEMGKVKHFARDNGKDTDLGDDAL